MYGAVEKFECMTRLKIDDCSNKNWTNSLALFTNEGQADRQVTSKERCNRRLWGWLLQPPSLVLATYPLWQTID